MLISAAYAAEAANTDSGGFFSDPEAWVAVTFIIMVIALARPLSRAIAKQLDSRRDAIKARLDEAQRLHAEAQAMLAQQQKRLREAQREAESMLSTARAEAERLKTAGAKDLDDLLARREQQALGRIAQAEADATRQVREVAVDLAVAAASKIIAEGMTPQKSAALIDRTIKDLGERLH